MTVAGVTFSVDERAQKLTLILPTFSGHPKGGIAAQANLLQAYVNAAPFAKDPATRERLLAEMSGFSDAYLRNGLRGD